MRNDALKRLAVVFSLSYISFGVAADDQPPTTPELSFISYSNTATEIFWTRSIDDHVALEYALSRNGQLLFAGDGLSYFDGSLELGERYVYELVVTGNDGLASTPASVTIQNGEFPTLPPLLPPTGLQASVYSSSALELFWDRVDGQTLTYFYYQDDALLGLTDGTSAFINENISAGTHTFEIQARQVVSERGDIDVSERVAIVVNVPGGPTTQPSAPENISVLRYSSTAAELFWRRPAASEHVVSTDVYRDGKLIGSTDGISFFDDSRSGEVDYTYSLVAINADGIESEAAFYPSSTNPVFAVTDDNIEDVVFQIVRIANGDVSNDLLTRAREFAELGRASSIEGITPVSATGGPGVSTVTTYSCDNGGSLVVTNPEDRDGGTRHFVEIADCNLDDRIFNGQVDYSFGIGGTRFEMAEFSSIFANGNSAVLTGVYLDNPFNSSGSRQKILEIASYEETNADGTKRPVSQLSTSVVFDTTDSVQAGFETSWTASGPFSNDVSLSAETVQEFGRTGDAQSNFTSGQLVVTAASGLILTIDADNGDPDTFSVTAVDGEDTSVFTLNWTDRNRFGLR